MNDQQKMLLLMALLAGLVLCLSRAHAQAPAAPTASGHTPLAVPTTRIP